MELTLIGNLIRRVDRRAAAAAAAVITGSAGNVVLV